MRAGEVCDLAADAVVLIGQSHWLRVPIGKLRNDRYVPLHPDLIVLLTRWTADNVEHIRANKRLVADHRGSLDRHALARIVRRVGRRAGVTVHPHQLRHTLATQAINRGMRLEAIAALLGHRTMDMTLTYAWIADRVVADQYEKINTTIDALYTDTPQLPADYETAGMAKTASRSPRPHARQTASAHDPLNSTAASNQPAKHAATSPPAPSSSPSCSANATPPETTNNPNAPISSTDSSTAPEQSLDNDHPDNGS